MDEMETVVVRGVEIGAGIPKVCVPIVGTTKEEIKQAAKNVIDQPIDLVEWRGDWFEDIFNFEKVEECLKELRECLLETPILFTFRTAKEGGEKSIEEREYVLLNQAVAKSGYVDLVDVELFMGENVIKEILEVAHEHGVKVIASNHDFAKTPEKEEIINCLKEMQQWGADLLKIAVMPQSKKDVLTLLMATEEMVTNYAKKPIITMSMANTGVLSRLCGEVFGSALTFGAVGKTSAPGQIGVEDLRIALEILHKSLV